MKKSAWLGMVVGALLWTSSASAQFPCLGDCNGDGRVAINELIIGVNIALSSLTTAACLAFDPDGNGSVAINDLITAVNNALNGCPGPPTPTRTIGSPTITPTATATVPTPTPTATVAGALCGNNVIETGEGCDDGNTLGGDGCAANCTDEDVRVSVFDPLKTFVIVQPDFAPIDIRCPGNNPNSPACVSGQQIFRTGQLRNETVRDKDGNVLFQPGQIPVAIRAEEVAFDPVTIPGVGCGCVRGVPVPAFGQGISGIGTIGCGDVPLTDISYRFVQDHNTNPGSAANRSQAMPNDAECDDQTILGNGAVYEACSEGTGEACSAPEQETVHTGVCNSPRALTLSGGAAPRGSALVFANISIGVLRNGNGCRAPDCSVPNYGGDCLPCTDDDEDKGDPVTVPLTTASAEGAVFDVNNSSTSETIAIEDGAPCTFFPCDTQKDGKVLDCDLLLSDPTNGGSGGSLALAFPALDSRSISDNVVSAVLTAK